MRPIPGTILIYIGWLAIALLIYPIAIGIPILIHMAANHITVTIDNIVPLTLMYGYGERTVLFMVLYSALLGIGQQVFLKYCLSIRIRYWALGTFLGGAISMLLLHTGQTPFGNSLNFVPWFFGFSIVQAILLYRYTSWSWLWVVAHLSIAGMFPLTMGGSVLELVLQWIIKAGIGGLVTMVILQIVMTRATAESTHPKRKSI